jgi:nucleoside-diphosphate-sugar epimerase
MSNQVAIVGGHGQVARQLHPLLLEAGRQPVGLVRSDDQRATLEAMGAQARLLNIERADGEAFGQAFAGCDAVVFSAGGGPDGNIERKRTVDLEGALKSIEGARAAGITRFVMVSAIDVDKPVPDDAPDVWKAYVAAKRDADEAVRRSGLDWTILRPGRLTDDAGTGLVALGEDVARAEIPRQDVAAVIAAVLDDDRTIGHQWNLVGGQVPVAEAIAAATGQSAREE